MQAEEPIAIRRRQSNKRRMALLRSLVKRLNHFRRLISCLTGQVPAATQKLASLPRTGMLARFAEPRRRNRPSVIGPQRCAPRKNENESASQAADVSPSWSCPHAGQLDHRRAHAISHFNFARKPHLRRSVNSAENRRKIVRKFARLSTICRAPSFFS